MFNYSCLDLFVKRVIRSSIDLIISIISFFIPSKSGKDILPAIDNQLLLEPAINLVEKIKSGQLKSETLVRAYINRIKTVDKFINAIIDERFECAINEAKEIDKKVQCIIDNEANADRSILELPLLGIPITGKDSIAIKGLYYTAGSVIRRGVRADEDSGCVKNLKKAGAILIALTNTPELCMWFDSDNKLYGRTNNPYDLSRIPGGSTGGNGACLSYAGAVIGIGSDIGGSIRFPSFFNGIFGHKTTPQVVPMDGHYPDVESSREFMLSFGPMSRYACDLLPFLKALAGDEIKKLPNIDSKVDFKQFKVYYIESFDAEDLTPVHPEIKKSIKLAAKHFADEFGCNIEELKLEEFKYAFDIYRNVLLAQKVNKTFSELMTREPGKQIAIPFELIKIIFGLSEHTLTSLVIAMIEQYQSTKASAHFLKLKEQLKEKLYKILDDNKAIIIAPVFPEFALKHRTTLFKLSNISYAGIFNLLEVPATACPLGLNADGLPLGCQIIAANSNDHVTIQAAIELEKKFGGWSPPCKVKIN